MHLDCVFSILGDRCCLMLEDMIGEDSPKRRLVDEYTRDAKTGVRYSAIQIASAGRTFLLIQATPCVKGGYAV